MEQQIVKEAVEVTDNGMLATLAGFLIASCGGLFKFVFSRLDKKLDKETFSQFEKSNDQAHKFTHTVLKEIKEKIK